MAQLRRQIGRSWRGALLGSMALACGQSVDAQIVTPGVKADESIFADIPVHDALSEREWRRVDDSIDRGLRFLAQNQQRDGSIASHIAGQPAVTSLAVMAYLSRGHHPGEGPYGDTLLRAVDYVLSCQEADGLLAADKRRLRSMQWQTRPHTATYNHAISGLMLGEVYGHGVAELDTRVKPAIEKALTWARRLQRRPPRYPEDVGGWRYLIDADPRKPRSDLSVTGWFIMFYRSARNAEFDVPQTDVEDAAKYVELCFDKQTGAFFYGSHRYDRMRSRGMTGAGLLTLTVSGRRDEEIARRAGDWLLAHPYDRYGHNPGAHDGFHYSAYYCSQAMYLLGGDYWRRFYTDLARTFVNAQNQDGGWPLETSRRGDSMYGRTYTTALSVLALTPPYQMLPIYQR